MSTVLGDRMDRRGKGKRRTSCGGVYGIWIEEGDVLREDRDIGGIEEEEEERGGEEGSTNHRCGAEVKVAPPERIIGRRGRRHVVLEVKHTSTSGRGCG